MQDIHIGVDVGGTFTDIAVNVTSENRMILHKLPSTPARPDEAIVRGVADVLRANGLAAQRVAKLAHGTTVGTNALIERRCGKVALVTTEGFRDLLEIGRQTRPKVYDMHQDHPAPLVPRPLRREVSERRMADGRVFKPLDEAAVRRVGEDLVKDDVDCVVVCFLHSYAYPEHEDRAVAILRSVMPDRVAVSSSSSVFPEFREYERFSTAVLNGALLTVMGDYLDRLMTNVEAMGIGAAPKISQSSGGLMSMTMARRFPIRASLSGPAAGALGAAHRARGSGHANIITLDMGGTSADVCLLIDGQHSEVRERNLAGFPLRMPAIDVNAVGAGGGSIAWIDRDGLLKVGPQSAGAEPGPACYGHGGTQATVTDANMVLGRLGQRGLLDGRMPVRADLAVKVVGDLAGALGLSIDETALGIIRVVSATMVKAIRSVSLERGHNPANFALFAFGGAGPLHAVDVARELEMTRVIVPPNPGILCAEGAMSSDLVMDFVKTLLARLDDDGFAAIAEVRRSLDGAAEAWFTAEAVSPDQRLRQWFVELRYFGQNYEIALPLAAHHDGPQGLDRLLAEFHRAHEHTYGFAAPGEPVQIVNLRLKAVGRSPQPTPPRIATGSPGRHRETRDVLFGLGHRYSAAVYRRADLTAGQHLPGPAIIEQFDATVVLHPGDLGSVDDWGNIIIAVGGA